MAPPEQWTTSVTDLLGLFHDALVALVPIAERARIRWRNGQAYDDWDAIASVIFENLVVRSLKYSDAHMEECRFAAYDIVLPSYRDVAFISVEAPEIPRGVCAVFVGFVGTSALLEQVNWIEVRQTGEQAAAVTCRAAYGGSKFSAVRWRDGTLQRTHLITVDV